MKVTHLSGCQGKQSLKESSAKKNKWQPSLCHQQMPSKYATSTKWIPTQVLQKQGYYQGSSQIWVPKTHVNPLVQKEYPKKTSVNHGHQAKWVPKLIQQSTPTNTSLSQATSTMKAPPITQKMEKQHASALDKLVALEDQKGERLNIQSLWKWFKGQNSH